MPLSAPAQCPVSLSLSLSHTHTHSLSYAIFHHVVSQQTGHPSWRLISETGKARKRGETRSRMVVVIMQWVKPGARSLSEGLQVSLCHRPGTWVTAGPPCAFHFPGTRASFPLDGPLLWTLVWTLVGAGVPNQGCFCCAEACSGVAPGGRYWQGVGGGRGADQHPLTLRMAPRSENCPSPNGSAQG